MPTRVCQRSRRSHPAITGIYIQVASQWRLASCGYPGDVFSLGRVVGPVAERKRVCVKRRGKTTVAVGWITGGAWFH